MPDSALDQALNEGARTYDSPTVSVGVEDLRTLLEERAELLAQVSALQTEMSHIVNNSLARQVRAFHAKFGHPIGERPEVPEESQVRFRLALIAEEFFEVLNSALSLEKDAHYHESVSLILDRVNCRFPYNRADVHVDFPEFVDGLADLMYVVEGTAAVCGVHMAPILAEVQRANMAKDAVYVEAKDDFKKGQRIKPQKPEGWQPPQISNVLKNQGWVGLESPGAWVTP